jgi:phage-related protein
MRIHFYLKGKSPVFEFIKGLEVRDRARILASLKSIEELGFETPRVEFRQIRGKLWEIKIRSAKKGYRIFYFILEQRNLILLHAYKKQSQKAPIREIELAENRMMEVLKNENAYIN